MHLCSSVYSSLRVWQLICNCTKYVKYQFSSSAQDQISVCKRKKKKSTYSQADKGKQRPDIQRTTQYLVTEDLIESIKNDLLYGRNLDKYF